MVPRSTKSPPYHTRRTLLERGAALLGTGMLASTAGCLSALPPLGRPQSFGRIDVPASEAPNYRTWVPNPGREDEHPSHGTVVYTEPGRVTTREPDLFLARRSNNKVQVDYFGIGYDAFDWLLKTDFGTVISASLDPTAVGRTLTESGYESAGTLRGFDRYTRSDTARRAAVSESTIVWSSSRVHDHPDVERLLRTAAGENPRYHEANADFDHLSRAMGANRLLIVGPNFGDPSGRAVLGADGFRFDGSVAFQVIKLLFPEDRGPETTQLERDFKDQYWTTDEARTFDVRVDGRLGTVETRVPPQPAQEVTPILDPPQITWGAEYDSAAQAVTIRHEAGDPVDTEWVSYHVEPVVTADRPGAAGKIELERLWPGTATVRPGDEATIDLSDRPDARRISVDLAGSAGFRDLFSFDLREAKQ